MVTTFIVHANVVTYLLHVVEVLNPYHDLSLLVHILLPIDQVHNLLKELFIKSRK